MIMLKIILKENNWLDRKYLDFGWGNGYVIIPKDHKSFDMDLDMLAVHGGVTFNKVLTDSWSNILISNQYMVNNDVIGPEDFEYQLNQAYSYVIKYVFV